MQAAIEAYHSSPSTPISVLARQYEVNRSTLSRRLRGLTASKQESQEMTRNLNNHQEQYLIEWIRVQSERCLPPTARIVTNVASELAGKELGRNWCSRFVQRHKDKLDTRYLHTLDLCRHRADSRKNYQAFFTIIQNKIEEYSITAENMYNMDEKGFLLGQLQKTRRIFTKDTCKDEKLTVVGQDGNREWITLLATICADGTSLTPAIIYQAVSGDVQDSWIQDFDPNEHACYFSASPKGWTSDAISFKWLTTLFHKETVQKARRSWRLLFVDGHGSHLNLSFLNWCEEHRILVACYPPHSTHRLQPLDVGMFRPLAQYYSQGLDHFMRCSEGITTIKKRDFFLLFTDAFQKAFTEQNVLSAWQKAGIWPFNPEEVLKSFPEPHTPLGSCSTPQKNSSLSPTDILESPLKYKQFRSVLRRVTTPMDRRSSKMISRLSDKLLRTSAELTIAKLDNKDLRESLSRATRQQKRQKKIVEQLRSEGATGTLFLSPKQIARARDINADREQHKIDLDMEKARKASERVQNRLNKAREAAQRKIDRARESQRKKEEAAAQKEQRKADREAAKASKQEEQRQKAIQKEQARQSRIQRTKQAVTEPSIGSSIEQVENPSSTALGQAAERTEQIRTPE